MSMCRVISYVVGFCCVFAVISMFFWQNCVFFFSWMWTFIAILAFVGLLFFFFFFQKQNCTWYNYFLVVCLYVSSVALVLFKILLWFFSMSSYIFDDVIFSSCKWFYSLKCITSFLFRHLNFIYLFTTNHTIISMIFLILF